MSIDAIFPSLVRVCALAALAVPVLIGVKVFRNATAERASPSLLFKAAVAALVWAVSTVGLSLIWVVFVLSAHGSTEAHPTPAMAWGHVCYLVTGGVMVCWVWRREKVKLP